MTLFELWDQWCEIVKDHNRKLTSNKWDPYYIFVPLLYGLAIAIIGDMILHSYRIDNKDISIVLFISSSVFTGLLMILNWISNE